MKPETAFQRSRVYELLAHVFSEPSDKFLDFVAKGEFLEHVKSAIRNLLHRKNIHFKEFKNLTEISKSTDIELILSEYEKLTSPQKNYFYECNYYAPSNAMEEMADIAGFYKAFGVAPDCERPDYISSELEFMRLLTIKEAKALMNNEAVNAEICLSAQKKFLNIHLGRWIQSLSQIADSFVFYSILCRFLNAWIDAECRYLSVRPDKSCFFSGSTFYENQSECFLKKER
jgi:nitrate reductase assembly molybdenum cofactor insertion protein NarJ